MRRMEIFWEKHFIIMSIKWMNGEKIKRNKMSVIFVKGHFKVNANYNKPLGKHYRKGCHWKTISTVRRDVHLFF